MSFGPQLPPGFKRPTPESDESSGDETGPIGPTLPPGLAGKPSASRKDSSSEEDDSIGPALPPGFKKQSDVADSSSGPKTVGPTLIILIKRLDPEFQYWKSLIFSKFSVLVALRGLLFFKTLFQL